MAKPVNGPGITRCLLLSNLRLIFVELLKCIWETDIHRIDPEAAAKDPSICWMPRDSDARLKVEPDGTAGTPDLCSPPVAGGYLGAENQAIRIQLVSGTEFTWGFDNAAPLYRVQLANDNAGVRRRIVMLTEPADQAHWPLSGPMRRECSFEL